MSKKMISIKLIKGGEQAIVSYNQSENMPGIGRVINSNTKRIRTPVSHEIRMLIKDLRIHLLGMCGFLREADMKGYDWEENDVSNLQGLEAVELANDLAVDYAYLHKDEIVLGGVLMVLNQEAKLPLVTPRITDSHSYQHYEHLEATLIELMEAVTLWEQSPEEVTKRQLSLEFVSIKEKVTLQDAEKILDEMSEEDQELLIARKLDKYLEMSKSMGDDEGEDGSMADQDGEKESEAGADVKAAEKPKAKTEKKSERISEKENGSVKAMPKSASAKKPTKVPIPKGKAAAKEAVEVDSEDVFVPAL